MNQSPNKTKTMEYNLNKQSGWIKLFLNEWKLYGLRVAIKNYKFAKDKFEIHRTD